MICVNLKYIKNINSIFKVDKFILCALNLSFLCFCLNNTINKYKNFIMWPDGFYGTILLGLKKIPGSKLITGLRLPKIIKRIVVIGNLNLSEQNFLKKKFKLKIQHNKLPIAKVEYLKKKIFTKFNTQDLVLITLPTPMQEIIANYISDKFKVKRIICIGGGLAIAAGSIPDCPRMWRKVGMEFIWRLRTDTMRRLKRLFYTFFVYHYKNLFYYSKKLRFVKI